MRLLGYGFTTHEQIRLKLQTYIQKTIENYHKIQIHYVGGIRSKTAISECET